MFSNSRTLLLPSNLYPVYSFPRNDFLRMGEAAQNNCEMGRWSSLRIDSLSCADDRSPDPLANQAADQPDYFEEEILVFENADSVSFPEPGQIVFVGSSSVRFWDSLIEGMRPLPIIQRGFGGAHMEHVLQPGQIVLPYAPRAVVVFVGVNDIGSGKTPTHVGNNFRIFVDRFQLHYLKQIYG